MNKTGEGELALSGTAFESGSAKLKVDNGLLRFKDGADFELLDTSARDVINMKAPNAYTREVVIDPGARVTVAGIEMDSGSANTVTVNGGTLTLLGGGESNDALVMRGNGSGTDRFIVNGGEVTCSEGSWVGVGFRVGDAYLTVNGGTTTMSRVSLGARTLYVDLSANSFVEVNGGVLEVPGTFNWMGSSTVGRINTVTIGNGTPGSGIWRTCATINSAYAANNQTILIFDGGNLETLGLSPFGGTSLENYLYGAKQVYVADGGARIDTRGLAVTITQDLDSGSASDGGLTKLGEGTLTLTGDCAFSGPITVNQGVLALPASVASTGLVVAAGAELTLANGAIQILALDVATLATAAKLTFEALVGESSCDRIELPVGATVGDLSIAVLQQGTLATVTHPGDYVIFTFAGSAPDITGWTLLNPPGGRGASFVIDGTSVLLRVTYAAGTAIWTTNGSGTWESAGNWTTSPANTAGAAVFLDDAISAPATVTLSSGSTLGYMEFNNVQPYTVAGAVLTLANTNGLDAVVATVQGVHTVSSAINAASNLTVRAVVDTGVVAAGGVSAVGTLTIEGPGSLSVADSSALAVNDLAMSGAGNLMVSGTTVFTLPVALGAGGGVFTPAGGQTVDLRGVVSGSGGLTKEGSSFLMLTNANASYTGVTAVNAGTLRIDTLPAGGFGLGQGTLHTIGANGTTAGGYTLDTGAAGRAAVLHTDNDITLQGNVNALSGALVKTGAGTVTFTAAGENVLSADVGAGFSQSVLDIGVNGDSPTVGFGGFSIAAGKVVLGAVGQTNVFNGLVVVGLNSTTNADAETAGTLEITGGVTTMNSDLIVGQSNGNTNTAPVARASKLRMTGGELTVHSLILGRAADAASHNSAPVLEMTGGLLTVTGACYLPEQAGAKATISLSGGKLDYLAAGGASLRFGELGGEATVTLSGSAVLSSGLKIFLGYGTGSTATLHLDGGTVIAQNLDSGGGAEGHVIFNGGVLRPSENNELLRTLSSATVSAGGAVLDISLVDGSTLKKTLQHDMALGGGDGGLTKTGAGTLTIGVAQAYDGPTVVTEGTLSLPLSGVLSNVTALTVSPGATLLLDAGAVQTLSLGGLSLGTPAAAPVNLTLSFAADGSTYDTLAVNGSATLGDVALTLQRVGQTETFAVNGAYSLITYTGADPVVTGLSVTNPLYGKKYTFTAGAGVIILTISSDTSGASYVWTASAGGAWESSGNWALAPGAGAPGQPVRFDSAATTPATVTVSSAVTLGAAYFNNANAYTLAGSSDMTFDNGSTQALVSVESGDHVLALPVIVANGGVMVETAFGAGLTLAGSVSGNGALIKSGAGALTVAAGSSRTAVTQILRGGLILDGGNTGTGELVLDGGDGIKAGATGAATVVNPVTLKSGFPVLDTTVNDLTLSGTLDWQGAVPYLYKTGTNTLTLAGTGGGVAAMNPRFLLREGGLRFASGANYLFDGQTKESLKLGSDANKSTDVVVEDGAHLILGGISMSASYSGVANNESRMTQEGGSVELRNTTGDNGSTFFLREYGTAPFNQSSVALLSSAAPTASNVPPFSRRLIQLAEFVP